MAAARACRQVSSCANRPALDLPPWTAAGCRHGPVPLPTGPRGADDADGTLSTTGSSCCAPWVYRTSRTPARLRRQVGSQGAIPTPRHCHHAGRMATAGGDGRSAGCHPPRPRSPARARGPQRRPRSLRSLLQGSGGSVSKTDFHPMGVVGQGTPAPRHKWGARASVRLRQGEAALVLKRPGAKPSRLHAAQMGSRPTDASPGLIEPWAFNLLGQRPGHTDPVEICHDSAITFRPPNTLA